MQKTDPATLQKMLSVPFGETTSVLMNQKGEGLLNMAAFNLQRASGSPGQEKFIEELLLPYMQQNTIHDLAVVSSGGRSETGKVLNDLLCQFEEEMGITFDSNEKASAMRFALLLVGAVCLSCSPKSAGNIGITKVGLLKKTWRYTGKQSGEQAVPPKSDRAGG